jgi:hypothetical protein
MAEFAQKKAYASLVDLAKREIEKRIAPNWKKIRDDRVIGSFLFLMRSVGSAEVAEEYSHRCQQLEFSTDKLLPEV